MDLEGYFSVRDILDYIFCPRSIYFQYVLKAGKEKTPKMIRGLEIHEEFSERAKRVKIVEDLPYLPRKFDVLLYSKKYNFNTRIDCILFEIESQLAYPVEFKSSLKTFNHVFKSLELQLAAQALAIEENFNLKVNAGYIKSIKNNEVVKLEITPNLKEEVVEALSRMQAILNAEIIPEPTPHIKKCINCYYKNLCRRI
jgi:CRISPR-associated exonuclease Cas4